MTTRQHSPTQTSARVWLLAAVFWIACAALFATQQWAMLRATPKQMLWIAAFTYQLPSWLLLVPATVVLPLLVRRHPLSTEHPRRFVLHAVASVLFGAVFLLVSVPVRHAFHPSPIRWAMFGQTLFKSAPQFILLGVVAYWLIVALGSLVDARRRLAALLAANATQPVPEPEKRSETTQPASDQAARRVTLRTATGEALVDPAEIEWTEPAALGAKVRLAGADILVRHSVTELQTLLAPLGFVRIHRSVLVNVAAIREVRGGASRDGDVVLTSGRRVPLSRRRRSDLEARLAELAAAN